jgi:hypothetical protein
METAQDLAKAQRIAAAYPPEARSVPRWEREAHMTETQQLAWLIRFDPTAAAEVMSVNGCTASQQLPADRTRPRASPNRVPHHG